MSDSKPLIVAPLREEIAPLLRQSGARPVLRAGALSLCSGHLAGHDLFGAIIGDGATAAGRGLHRLLEEVTPERVLLIGFAGGLSDDLAGGVLIQAGTTALLDGSERVTASDASLPDLDRAAVISSSRILSTAGSKQKAWHALGSPQRCVVDLESAVLARQLEEANLPWTIVRAVSDAHDEHLPLDFGRLSNDEGGIERSRVLAALLRRPLALGGLLRMRSRARSCALALARTANDWLSL
jgi:nucleoside phosphorylase